MRYPTVLLVLAACTDARELDVREQRIISVLAEDNYMWARRDPGLVARKLTKMQRGPYAWMRGTAALFWRDAMEPGSDRPEVVGDEASSRVLLVGDPHPENVGTYRASDGTMFLDWNDFDASGYGPFTGDLRRLIAGLALAAAGSELEEVLARRAASSYAAIIATLARGDAVAPIGPGRSALFDDELAKAATRGAAQYAVDELAPVIDGVRVLAVGDLEDVAADGVLEDRVTPVSTEEALWIDAAIAQWRPNRLSAAAAVVKLRARRIGSGVSSYPALRYNVVLEGETLAPEDDRIVELKETRDGLIIDGLPRLASAEWTSPAARAVDTQRRLQARNDGDLLLGAALVGALSLKIRNREAYQRGIDVEDLTALATGSAADRAELADIASVYGELLARAHGQARTETGARGATVIAPLLAGREAAFVDAIVAVGLADAAQITEDHARMKELDLAALVVPRSAP